MATSTITNTVTDPSGAAVVGARIVARLVPSPAFRIAEGSEIKQLVETVTDASGNWSLALERTANITPANSNYEVTEYLPDAPKKHTIQVVGNASLRASLVTPPPPADGNTYLTQAAADARYALLGGSTFGSPTLLRPGLVTADGVSTSVARSDHRHAIDVIWANAGARPAATEGLLGYQADIDQLQLGNGTSFVPYGNIVVCTSATRPATPFKGLAIYETDTDKLLVYTTATTGWVPPWNSAWGYITGTTAITTTNSASAAFVDITGAALAWTQIAANRRHRYTIMGHTFVNPAGATAIAPVRMVDAALALKGTPSRVDTFPAVAATVAAFLSVQPLETGIAAGAVARKLQVSGIAGGNGTFFVDGASGRGALFMVEDIGPNGSPV